MMAQAIRGIYQSPDRQRHTDRLEILQDDRISPATVSRMATSVCSSMAFRLGGKAHFRTRCSKARPRPRIRGFTAATFEHRKCTPNLMPGTKRSGRWLSAKRSTTSVDHTQLSPYEWWLSWSAIVFSADVKDVEGDGVPDGIEERAMARRAHHRREWRPAPEPQRDGRQAATHEDMLH